MGQKKVIVRVKGGLGNQLFCYAAAKGVAVRNEAELVIDDTSGFARDYKYRRKYELGRFNIPHRRATPSERMDPFERARRGVAKYFARTRPFHRRSYIEQRNNEFDARLLGMRVEGSVYLDGLWQSESYFADVVPQITEDLRMEPLADSESLKIVEQIEMVNAVSVHLRFFEGPTDGADWLRGLIAYYSSAMDRLEEHVTDPHYFIFSDRPDHARQIFDARESRATFVTHNDSQSGAYGDLWLMSKCKHSIIASSTFSWWGAWLGECPGKSLIVAPASTLIPGVAWALSGQIPQRWSVLQV